MEKENEKDADVESSAIHGQESMPFLRILGKSEKSAIVVVVVDDKVVVPWKAVDHHATLLTLTLLKDASCGTLRTVTNQGRLLKIFMLQKVIKHLLPHFQKYRVENDSERAAAKLNIVARHR